MWFGGWLAGWLLSVSACSGGEVVVAVGEWGGVVTWIQSPPLSLSPCASLSPSLARFLVRSLLFAFCFFAPAFVPPLCLCLGARARVALGWPVFFFFLLFGGGCGCVVRV